MWAEPSDLPKPVSRASWKQFSSCIWPTDQATNMRAKCQVHVHMHRDLLQIIYTNVRYVITNYYQIIKSKAPVSTSALIILIKQHRCKAKGVNQLLSTVKGSSFISGRSLDVIIKMQVASQCSNYVRAMRCPLQFLSSIRFVSPCPQLSQIRSDTHSRSCWTLELFAVRLLLLMWIGCVGQSRGRVESREAISNPLPARMKPFNLQQLCGGSLRGDFLNEAPSYCSLLKEGKGQLGCFWVFCCFSVSSASIFQLW